MALDDIFLLIFRLIYKNIFAIKQSIPANRKEGVLCERQRRRCRHRSYKLRLISQTVLIAQSLILTCFSPGFNIRKFPKKITILLIKVRQVKVRGNRREQYLLNLLLCHHFLIQRIIRSVLLTSSLILIPFSHYLIQRQL